MPYSLKTIHATVQRIFKKSITRKRLREELEMVTWEPEIGRMIVISDTEHELAASEKYGVFLGMSTRNLYKTTSGSAPFARLLTAEEIAKCY